MQKFIKFSKDLLLKNKKELYISCSFVLILITIQIFLPLSMRWIISEVNVRQSYLFLIICVLVYSIFLLIYNFINISWYMSLDKLGGKILQNIREDLCNAISKSSYEKLLLIGKEKLKNILYMDTLNMFSCIAVQSINIIANTLLIIVFLFVSTYINIKLTLVLFIAFVIGFVISMLSRKPIAESAMKVNKKMKEDNKTLNEYIDALELVKTNELNDYFIKKNNKSLWSFINTSLKADKIQLFLRNIITEFHQVVTLLISAILSMTMNSSSFGDIVYYLFVTNMVLNTSQSLEESIYSLIKMLPSFKNVDEILNLEKTNESEQVETIEKIEFKNVNFFYESSGKVILDNKNYLFKKGDVVRVVGVNGGGKSTFVKLIIGLLSPKNGEILINDKPINNLSQNCLKNQILYIDQDEIILNDDVQSYVEAISRQKVSASLLNELKEKVKFDENIKDIRDNGRSISGGQRKKLLLIKLLMKYKKSSVIILDEIEAGLDEETKAIVLEVQKDIIKDNKDCIIFKITHEARDDSIYSTTIEV